MARNSDLKRDEHGHFKPKFTYEILNTRINEYLDRFDDIPYCLAQGKMPTKDGLYLYMKINQKSISNWMNDKACDNSSYDDDSEYDVSYKRLIEDAFARIKDKLLQMELVCEFTTKKTSMAILGYLNSSAFDLKGNFENPNKSNEMTLSIKMDKEMELDAK